MITRNTAYSNGTHYKRIPAFSLLIACTTLALRRFWRHSPLLSPLLTPEHGASAFSIQLELADLIALGILPWKGGRKKKVLARAPGFLISSLSLRCIGAFSLVSPPLCGTQSWPVPTTHCLCVCVCAWSGHFHEKGVQRMDRGCVFFLWDGCRRDWGCTRATSSIMLWIA